MDYLKVNRALWNSRVPHHYNSEFYDVPGFLNGADTLTEIEGPLLGDIQNKHVVHLQCHFGLDTLSLARRGAHITGIDFSEEAIKRAKALATQAKLDARFIQSDVYEADTFIKEQADLVFTTYGVLGWLPDLYQWAKVVANCLRPGGALLLVEFHPVLWMFDNSFKKPAYSYFNREPIIEQEEGTYAQTDAPISMPSIGWNHSLGEVFEALTNAGFDVIHFLEYDFSPYPAFSNSVPAGERRWHIKGLEGILPMVYSLKAIKR